MAFDEHCTLAKRRLPFEKKRAEGRRCRRSPGKRVERNFAAMCIESVVAEIVSSTLCLFFLSFLSCFLLRRSRKEKQACIRIDAQQAAGAAEKGRKE